MSYDFNCDVNSYLTTVYIKMEKAFSTKIILYEGFIVHKTTLKFLSDIENFEGL